MILYFLALGIGGIVITGLFSFYSAREALLERSYNQLTSIRLTRKAAIERFFTDRLHETAFLASSGNCSISSLPSSDYYAGSVIFDSSGNIISKEQCGNERDYSEPLLNGQFKRQFLKGKLLKGKQPVIADFSNNKVAGNGLLTICPLAGNGNFLGLFIRPTVIDSIMLEVDPQHGLGYSGETYLAGDDFLMRTSSRFIKNSVMSTRVHTLPAVKAVNGEEGVMISSDYRGIQVLSSYGRINAAGLQWVILAEIDYSEATASVYSIRNSIILMSLLTAIGLFILSYVISKSITRPLKRLKQAAAGIGKGYAGAPLPVESDDEIGDLTEAFNLMAIDLQAKEEALKSERTMRVSSAIDGQDKERQRLSRELHDGIGQTIIGIRLRMSALENEIPDKIKDAYSSLININDNLIDEVRAVSNALMPPALAEFGLISAVRSIGNNISDATGISVEVRGQFHENLFGRKPTLYIFRIIQEAMNNAARHSGAGSITTEIDVEGGMLFLKVSDNGKGFDPELACHGHGLLNIRERVNLLRGKLSIVSATSGTTVCAEIPVNKVQYDKIIAG